MRGKLRGTDAAAVSQAIAQASYSGSADSADVKVENNGTIDFLKKYSCYCGKFC